MDSLCYLESLTPCLDLTKVKSTPTDSELSEQVVQTEEKVRI